MTAAVIGISGSTSPWTPRRPSAYITSKPMGLVMSPQAWPVNAGDEAVASAGEDENPVRGVESDVLEEAREAVMGRSVEGVRSAVRVKRRVSTPLGDLLRAKFLYPGEVFRILCGAGSASHGCGPLLADRYAWPEVLTFLGAFAPHSGTLDGGAADVSRAAAARRARAAPACPQAPGCRRARRTQGGGIRAPPGRAR